MLNRFYVPLFFALVVPLLAAGPGLAQEPSPPKGKPSVAKNAATPGAWIARADEKAPWRNVDADEAIPAGDLLVSLPGAALVTNNGAVRLTAWGDFDSRSPLPILETGVILRSSEGFDLDVYLDRGRIDLKNTKESGPARVKLSFQHETWEVTLDEPGAEMAVNTYGRWPAGVIFRKAVDRPTQPLSFTLVLVTKGTITLKTPTRTVSMKEPPGTSLAFWECSTGECAEPLHLNRLPDWIDQSSGLSDRAKRASELLEEYRKLRVEVGPNKAVEIFHESDDVIKQGIALIGMAAQDDLPRLAQAMASARNPEIWDHGITVLRHWLGRSADHPKQLSEFFSTRAGYEPHIAKTGIELLYGFTEEETRSPALYQILIRLLTAEQRPIRNLAAWHLYRLVPGAREKIPFKPNASEEEFEQLAKAWQEYLPPGKVPREIGSEDEPIKPEPKN